MRPDAAACDPSSRASRSPCGCASVWLFRRRYRPLVSGKAPHLTPCSHHCGTPQPGIAATSIKLTRTEPRRCSCRFHGGRRRGNHPQVGGLCVGAVAWALGIRGWSRRGKLGVKRNHRPGCTGEKPSRLSVVQAARRGGQAVAHARCSAETRETGRRRPAPSSRRLDAESEIGEDDSARPQRGSS